MKRYIKKTVKKLAPGLVEHVKYTRASLDELKLKTNHIAYLLENMQNHDSRLDILKVAYSKVEPYQPIYGVSGFSDDARRDSKDRCAAILEYFGGNVEGLRALDIGSSLGYVSFYLQDRGANVEGWDFNPDNVDVAKAAQAINGLDVRFRCNELTLETVKTIKKGEFDVAIILSVLHHTISHNGVDYVKSLMKELTDKVPVLIVELARKGEDKNLFWNESQPDDELTIFKKIDGSNIDKVGEFGTHLSFVKRPLYVVTRKVIYVNSRPYEVEKLEFSPYENSPSWRPIFAEYYSGKQHFIKVYNLMDSSEQATKQIVNEISVLQQLGAKDGFPELLNFELGREQVKIVLSKAQGRLLDELVRSRKDLDSKKTITTLLKALSDLEELGFQHNDLRSWNVIVAPNGTSILIDFGHTAPLETENNKISFLWILWSILSHKREDYEQNKAKIPPKELFAKQPFFKKFYDVISKRPDISFRELSDLAKDQ